MTVKILYGPKRLKKVLAVNNILKLGLMYAVSKFLCFHAQSVSSIALCTPVTPIHNIS